MWEQGAWFILLSLWEVEFGKKGMIGSKNSQPTYTTVTSLNLFESQPEDPWNLCCDVGLEPTGWQEQMQRVSGMEVWVDRWRKYF